MYHLNSNNLLIDLIQARNLWSSVYLPYRVEGIFDGTAGKAGSSVNNVVIVDYDYFFTYLSENLNPDASADFRSRLSTIPLRDYSQFVMVNLPPPRADVYNNADFAVVRQRAISHFSIV